MEKIKKNELHRLSEGWKKIKKRMRKNKMSMVVCISAVFIAKSKEEMDRFLFDVELIKKRYPKNAKEEGWEKNYDEMIHPYEYQFKQIGPKATSFELSYSKNNYFAGVGHCFFDEMTDVFKGQIYATETIDHFTTYYYELNKGKVLVDEEIDEENDDEVNELDKLFHPIE